MASLWKVSNSVRELCEQGMQLMDTILCYTFDASVLATLLLRGTMDYAKQAIHNMQAMMLVLKHNNYN